jgi:hypothetical protein
VIWFAENLTIGIAAPGVTNKPALNRTLVANRPELLVFIEKPSQDCVVAAAKPQVSVHSTLATSGHRARPVAIIRRLLPRAVGSKLIELITILPSRPRCSTDWRTA